MEVDTGSFRALTDEVARLGDEVTRLAGIREVLEQHIPNLAIADFMVSLGRSLERNETTCRRARPRQRAGRPEYLRAVEGDPR